MAAGPPEDDDLLAFIARMHQGDAMTQREAQLLEAVKALEGVHRQASQSLQALGQRGSRRPDVPRTPQPAAQPDPVPGPAAGALPHAEVEAPTTNPVDVVTGEGRELTLDARTLTHIVRPGRGRG